MQEQMFHVKHSETNVSQMEVYLAIACELRERRLASPLNELNALAAAESLLISQLAEHL